MLASECPIDLSKKIMRQFLQLPTSGRFPKLSPVSRTLLAVSSAALLSAGLHAAPIVISSAPGSYTQDFNTLNTTGSPAFVDDSTIAGVSSQRSGTGNSIVAGTGSANGGGLYSYGTGTNADRALGTIGSGNVAAGNFAHGVQFQNTSGSTVTINSLAYAGEQWRKSGDLTAQALTLWYKIGSSAVTALEPLSDVGWTALPSGDFTSPVTTATGAALDGNAAANRTEIAFDPALDLSSGQFVMFRWKDIDHVGADHGLAIDDVSVGWTASASPAISVSATPNSFAENAGASASSGTVTIPVALGANLIVDLVSSDNTEATVPSSVTIFAGMTSANFTISAVDDLLADGSQAVNLTASSAGYVSGQTVLSVTNDTDAAITVSILPASFGENAGPTAATGNVTLAEDTPFDLTVDLISSDPGEATVPASVTILAGTKTIGFVVDAIDDTAVDGTQNVTIGASAMDYTSGSLVIQVTDDGDVAPPATLSPGAIAFTGFSADGDDALSFVVLAPIADTDVIHFTDNEWNGSPVGAGGIFNVGEGTLTWTPPSGGVAAGTVISFVGLSSPSPAASEGTLVESSGSYNASGDGETVYAYQGDLQVATGFLAVVTTTTGDSTAGTGLTASNIVTLTANVDIAEYTGSRTGQSSFPGYLPLIDNTATNWITQNGTGDQSGDGTAPDVPFDDTDFTISGSGADYATYAAANAGGQGPTLDFDNDGVTNGVEYFFGATGSTFTSNPVPNAAGQVSYPHPVATPGTTFIVKTSPDLVTWTPVTHTESGGFVRYTLPSGQGKIFVRLEVVVGP